MAQATAFEHRPRPATGRGFSLVESLVALLLVGLFLSGVATLLADSGRAARRQADLAELQQSARVALREIVRQLRMTGRGGLAPAAALEIRSGVSAHGDDARVARDERDSPVAVAETDIVIVRGVLSGALFQVDAGSLMLSGEPPDSGSVRVSETSPSGVPQPLAELRQIVRRGRSETLLLVSTVPSLHSVVELDAAASRLESGSIRLAFSVPDGPSAAGYRSLSSGADPRWTATSLAAVGVLEEYRYYVRKEYRVAGQPESGLAPRLSKARLTPGSETAHLGRAANLRLDVAGGIVDLQAALAVDRDGDGQAREDTPPTATDEWLFNAPGEAAGEPEDGARPLWVRVTAVGLTPPDPRYLAPPIEALEDREYGESDPPQDAAERRRRAHRRLVLRSTVGPRNLW